MMDSRGKICMKHFKERHYYLLMTQNQKYLEYYRKNQYGEITRLLINPVDKAVIIFVGSKKISWITQDCGETVSGISKNLYIIYSFMYSRVLREFQFHPTQRDWILATSWTTCESKPTPCNIFVQLFLTKDLGEVWEPILGYINQFEWAIQNNNEIPKERIIATFAPNSTGNQTVIRWDASMNLYYSDDFFQTVIEVFVQNNGQLQKLDSAPTFKLMQDYLIAAEVQNDDQNGKQIHLLISDPSFFEFHAIQTEENQFKDNNYRTVSVSPDKLYIAVNHLHDSNAICNVYLGDKEIKTFKKVVDYLVRGDGDTFDFLQLSEVNNAIIINVYPKIQANHYEDSLTYYQTTGFFKNQKETFTIQELLKFKQTKITFDSGQTWNYLKAPAKDVDGNSISCLTSCFLHLNLQTGLLHFPPLYQQKEAPLLIIGTGNVGSYLLDNKDKTNTYLSNDGGRNWYEIAQGLYIYEIYKHGDIIMLANYKNYTNEVQYSLNQGVDWIFIELDIVISISNIIIKPNSTKPTFLIYGNTLQDKETQGILLQIQLKTKVFHPCKGINNRKSLQSDFEEVQLSNQCQNGYKITFVVRKRESSCLVTDNINHIIEPCECENSDYYCEPGFERSQDKCVKVREISQQEQCLAKQYWIDFNGYQKKRNNRCSGGQVYIDSKYSCFSYDYYIGALLVFIFGLIIYVFRKFYLREKVEEQLRREATKDRQIMDYELQDEDENETKGITRDEELL